MFVLHANVAESPDFQNKWLCLEVSFEGAIALFGLVEFWPNQSVQAIIDQHITS